MWNKIYGGISRDENAIDDLEGMFSKAPTNLRPINATWKSWSKLSPEEDAHWFRNVGKRDQSFFQLTVKPNKTTQIKTPVVFST